MSVLKTDHVSKEFSGVLALDDVSIEFQSGKVNALLGKNGAGKSTLIKIFSGALAATQGKIYLDDQQLEIQDEHDAINRGIVTVYQELSLLPNLSIAENIFIGRLPTKGKIIDWNDTFRRADVLLAEMDIHISSKTLVEDLNMWQRQIIEIIKALSHNPKVLLLDEPTSSLAKSETEKLFKFIKRIKEKDIIIIYISHRLHELESIADNCSVLRDGKYIGTIDMDPSANEKIINMMFGDVKVNMMPDDIQVDEEVSLEVRGLSRSDYFSDINFKLRKGEIVGIAGMLGSGRTELLKSIFGIDPYNAGAIYYFGKEIKKPTPIKMKKLGIVYTPEDRKGEGLIQELSIKNNLCMASLEKLTGKLFMDKNQEQNYAQKMIDNLEIKVNAMDDWVSSLSGGGQQKVVVGKWLNTNPQVIMFDEPTRGIDVHAKQEIFKIIWEQAQKGVSCIVVSSELEELLEVCHRIIIMRLGRFMGEFSPAEVDVQKLYGLCMGGAKS